MDMQAAGGADEARAGTEQPRPAEQAGTRLPLSGGAALDGGALGALIRAHDWAATPLGPPESWPSSLSGALGLLLNVPQPMWIGWGPHLVQLYNDAYSGLLDAARHPAALGRPAAETWAEIWLLIGPDLEAILAGGPGVSYADRLVRHHRDGALRDLYFTYCYAPIPDATARSGVGGVLCVATETTERVEAEAALRASEDRYRHLVEQASDGIWIADQQGRFVHVNPAACALLGYARDQHLRLSVHDLIRTDDAPRLRDLMAGLAAGHQVTDIWRLRRADGTYLPLELSQTFTANGHWQAIGRDLTARHRADDALRALPRLQDAFLDLASHELRTPLTPSLAYMQMLPRALAAGDTERASRYAALAAEQLQRLNALVSDLLDVSRLRGGPPRLRREMVDLAAVARRAAEAARLSEPAPPILADLPPEPLWVRGDAARLEQVVTNLLTNAIVHAADSPRIELRLRLHPPAAPREGGADESGSPPALEGDAAAASGGIRAPLPGRGHAVPGAGESTHPTGTQATGTQATGTQATGTHATGTHATGTRPTGGHTPPPALPGDGGRAVLEVRDYGRGVEPSDLPALFSRFYQVERPDRPAREGLGLGLYIVRQLVEAHGGRVEATSAPGQGATFTVTLPLAAG